MTGPGRKRDGPKGVTSLGRCATRLSKGRGGPGQNGVAEPDTEGRGGSMVSR